MPPFRARARLIVCSSLLCVASARAQQAGETIEVHGDRPEGSARAPASQSTVIEASKYAGEVRSVADMLLGSPGVLVHALGGPGQVATLSLRGASADQSMVLLDGIPLQGPGGGAVDLSTLPATLLDRMVVSRGVLGAQFGAGALGGVVELIPRAPRGETTAGFEASVGSFESGRVAVDAAAPVGSGTAMIALQGDRTEGAFHYSRQLTPEIQGAPYYGFLRENADAMRGSGLLRLVQELGTDTGLDVLVQGSAGERGNPGPASQPTPRSRELDAGGVAGLRLRGEGARTSWSVRAFGRLDRIELRGTQPFGDCNDGEPDCPRIEQRASGARIEGALEIRPSDGHALGLLVSGGGDWVTGGDTGDHSRPAAAVAIKDDVTLPAGVALHPAVRFDKVGPESGVSPAVGVTWKPLETLEWRASWGLSFRAPTFTELYLDRGGIAANPGLQPEHAWSVDAGVAFRRERVTLSLGVFWSAYRDLILYELFPPARVKPFNVGRARIAGLELQAVVPLSRGFLAELSYSFLDAVNRDDGNQLAYRAPHRVLARLARHGDRLEGYAEAGFTSAMPRNAFETAYVGSQLLLGAGAGVRVTGSLWLDVEGRNLLDARTYEDLFQYPLPGISVAVIARARL